MSRRPRLAPFLVPVLFAAAGIVATHAQVATFTWTGLANDPWFYENDNWAGRVAPVAETRTELLVFGNVGRTHVRYPTIHVHGVQFAGNTRPYFLEGNWDSLHLAAGGITYAPAGNVHSTIDDLIGIWENQTWNIASGSLTIVDPLYSGETTGNVTKTGAGTLILENPYSTWSGDLILSAGRVAVTSPYYGYVDVLGTGTLVFNGGTLAAFPHSYGPENPVMIPNHIISNGLISTVNATELKLGFSGEGNSLIELAANTSVVTRGHPLFLLGDVVDKDGPRSLSLDSRGILLLEGFNTYTGGTNANQGIIVFTHEDALPDTGSLKAGPEGYIGRMFDPSGEFMSIATYLNRFDKANTAGSVGFDSDPDLEIFNDHSGAIDLGGFHVDARLGSATLAILSGLITPQGTTTAPYRFGGGGGVLVVSSQLNDTARALIADSTALGPLTLGLGSLTFDEFGNASPALHPGNAFTGGVTAKHSAVIFGPGAMPATGSFNLDTGGYIGVASSTETTEIQGVAGFIGRFPNSTGAGIIGFDYFGDNNTAQVSEAVNLGSITGPVYIGTATNAHISGTITTTNGGADPYRFAAYKEGELDVSSTLDGARAVIIGDPNSPATFGDFREREYAEVTISGNNSYTGGTTFWGGELNVGQANGVAGTDPTTALGTGALTVNAMPFPAGFTDLFPDEPQPSPSLDVVTSGTIIANNVVLNTNLNVSENAILELSGVVSGPGSLNLEDWAELTLSGANTFSGGVYVGSNGFLAVKENTSLGTGKLGMGGSSTTVDFTSAAPVVHGLESDDWNAGIRLSDNTVLTINQSASTVFRGNFFSLGDGLDPDTVGSARLVKTGLGSLRLESEFYPTPLDDDGPGGAPPVGVVVQQGTLIGATSNAFGFESVRVTGGTIATDGGWHQHNEVLLDAGRIAGNGSFISATVAVNGILSPGLFESGGIGQLGFFGTSTDNVILTLATGGVYEWNLSAADPTLIGAFDTVHVFHGGAVENGTLNITAGSTLPADKFTLKLISLLPDGTPGMVGGFLGTRSYTWTILDAEAVTGFDPDKFIIDATQFFTNLPVSTLSLSQVGNSIQLTFQPVPEPSTYALMALGLGFVWLTWRRRRAG